jgi:hypothetical protein
MSCSLSLGRIIPCSDAVGGLDAIYFINYDDKIMLADIDFNNTNTDMIDSATGNRSLYKYDLKGTSTFNQVMNSSRENGTTFVEQTLVLNLPVMSVKMHKEFKLLAWGNPQVVVKTNAGNYFLVGLEHGCDVTTINANSGAAMGDMTGYEVTLVAREKTFANYFVSLTDTQLDTAICGTGGIVVGE